MKHNKKPIFVSMEVDENYVVLNSAEGSIRIKSSHPEKICLPDRADFAVWFFLPIAMRENRPLHIIGTGYRTTIKNAFLMSSIWQSWLPGHFFSVAVSFDTELTPNSTEILEKRDLCFYSGGVDSTYMMLSRMQEGKSQDLITIHGMDYKLKDRDKAQQFLIQTQPFSEKAGDERIIVEMDAYSLYDKFDINPENHHVSHIFALAGSGFLHSRDYNSIYIAADYRLDQQFLVYPWGSNSATNFLFDTGDVKLITLSDDITRSQKMELLTESKEALTSLTFCVDYQARPQNCGVCSKCMRTKLMFIANVGNMPNIFKNENIPEKWVDSFKYDKPSEMAFLVDIISSAKINGNTEKLPAFDENEKEILEYNIKKSNFSSKKRKKGKLHKRVTRVISKLYKL